MLGHCAGLRDSQKLGDYVLAHAYVREDHVLDEELPLWIPVPALAEVQLALEQSVADITASQGAELKQWMRTGTVVTTDNRNWELLPESSAQRRLVKVELLLLIWKVLRSQPMDFASGCPTGPCYVSVISRYMAISSYQAWPTSFIDKGCNSIFKLVFRVLTA
jgi:hypothetical protein